MFYLQATNTNSKEVCQVHLTVLLGKNLVCTGKDWMSTDHWIGQLLNFSTAGSLLQTLCICDLEQFITPLELMIRITAQCSV